MNNSENSLNKRQARQLFCDLLNQQPISLLENDAKTTSQGLWLDRTKREDHLRVKRLQNLAKMDRLHASGIHTHYMPKVAGGDSEFVSLTADNFRLDIQALSEDQRLPGEAPAWILTLELLGPYAETLDSNDQVSLKDSSGRLWLQQAFNSDCILIAMWPELQSPMLLLAELTLYLEVS